MKKVILGGLAILAIAAIAGGSKQHPTSNLTVTPANSQATTATSSQESAKTTVSATPAATSQTTTSAATSTPAVASTPATNPAPAPQAAAPTANTNCNPNYSPCIPNSPTDLNCIDIKMRVKVTGTDVYRLDRDHDGYGCESYQ